MLANYANFMQAIFMNNRTPTPTGPDAEPARKKRGALLVYERLRDDIMWMQIAPGSALDEVALARTYGVSRTPVREALLLLANEGFVQFLPNRTSIVAPLSLENIPEFLDTFLLLSRGMLRSVAMKGVTDVDTLAGFVDAYRDGLDSGDCRGAFQAQLDLYRYIAALSQNRFLEKYFLEAQDASVRLKQRYFFPILDEAERLRAVRHLCAVVDAVAESDPDASDQAVVRSILFEAGIVQRSLGPRFGHEMAIDPVLSPEGDPQ